MSLLALTLHAAALATELVRDAAAEVTRAFAGRYKRRRQGLSFARSLRIFARRFAKQPRVGCWNSLQS